jgi:FtsZ-binding cell division protein ZapB
MVFRKTLFDDDQLMEQPKDRNKEAMPLDKLRSLEDKISVAIERVKTLKEEKTLNDKKLKELERILDEKNVEVEQLRADKNLIKSQLEALLGEIETLELE